MSLNSDLTAIKNVQDGVKNNKVTRFAYTQTAYTNDDVNGHSDYVPTRDNNIPLSDLSVIEVNQTVVDKGFRARASALNRMFLNHLFGRVSYNLNKINDLFNDLLVKIVANLGVANGLATLDATGRIPYSQLPEDAMEYQGDWDAQTNTPTLVDGTGTKGDTYNVTVAGTQTFGGQSIHFYVGDRIVYNGSVWQRFSSGDVQSVCEIPPDPDNANVDLTKQNNIYKLFPVDFINKLFHGNNAKVWTRGTVNLNTSQYIVYANGIWVAGSRNQGIWWSEDGKSWTQGLRGTNSTQYIVYANGLWVAGSLNVGFWWSEDGKNWTQGITQGITGTNTTQYIVYANGLWVAGSSGRGIWWSTDGKNWTRGTGVGTTDIMQYIVYANGIWIAGSDSHGIWWSEDGKSWTHGTGDSTAYDMTVYDIVYANGLWVAGSSSHGIWWSTDGKSWTQGTGANTTYTMRYIVYANGVWVAGSLNHGIWWSTDGKSWTQGTGDNTTYTLRYIVYANGVWVAGSDSHGIWWSEDGKNWTQGTGDNTTYTMQYIVCANGLWVAGGAAIWWSYALSPEIL